MAIAERLYSLAWAAFLGDCRSTWARAPSHAVHMSSMDGVPSRLMIRSNWEKKTIKKINEYID